MKLQRQVNNVLKSIVKRTKQIMFFCPPTRGSVHAVRSDTPLLYAFELLWLNGADLRNLPLIDRKKRLAALVKKSGCERIIYVQHIEREGSGSSRKFAGTRSGGDRRETWGALYREDHSDWLKIKNRSYSQAEGRQRLGLSNSPRGERKCTG